MMEITFSREFGFNSGATGCKRHSMTYSVFVKLTAVQVLSRFVLFCNSIENPYLFSCHPHPPSENFFGGGNLLPFVRLCHPSAPFNAFFAERTLQSIAGKSFSAYRVPLYTGIGKNTRPPGIPTPFLTRSIIHTSSSALKCHSPRRDFQWYIAPLCLRA